MCLDLYSNRHTTANCLRWEALLCVTLIAYINDLYCAYLPAKVVTASAVCTLNIGNMQEEHLN